MKKRNSQPLPLPGAWAQIRHGFRWPKTPAKAFRPRTLPQVWNWSVVVVEVLVTWVVIAFGNITFWWGTWSILDLAYEPYDLSGVTIAFCLGIGYTVLLVLFLAGRFFLARFIYRKCPPASWWELFVRTFLDRAVLYTQAWAGISIWKGIWNTWDYVSINSVISPLATAWVGHVTGLVLLLISFAFRGAVMPPMVYTEDSIFDGSDTTTARWDLLSQFLSRKEQKRKNPLAFEWKSTKIELGAQMQ